MKSRTRKLVVWIICGSIGILGSPAGAADATTAVGGGTTGGSTAGAGTVATTAAAAGTTTGTTTGVTGGTATGTTTGTTATQTQAGATGGTQVSATLGGDFAGFAGSGANAASLVRGLRSGAPITLDATGTAGGTGGGTGATGTGSTTSSVTFTVPTHPMGYGNVYIGLALARQQLANLGLTQPTPDQIRAALVGGTVTTSKGTTTLPGTLTLRSQGMGWGEIAKAEGVKLGPIVRRADGVAHQASALNHRDIHAQSHAGRERHHEVEHERGERHAQVARSHIVTAAGATTQVARSDEGRARVVSANGATGLRSGGAESAHASEQRLIPAHRGIVTAAGTGAAFGPAAQGARSSASGIVRGDGAGASGKSTASGHGHDR